MQRYFVEGMLRAIEARGQTRLAPAVEELIPHGAACCHFVADRLDKEDEKHPWDAHSDELGNRAFQKLKDKKEKG